MMLKYYILIIFSILSSVMYTLFFFRRFNVSLHNKEKKLFRVSPSRFSAYILALFLAIGFVTSIYDVTSLKREKLLAEEYTVENIYLKEGFGNSNFEYIYTEFNLYFAGIYSSDGEFIVCITEGSPPDLLEYLNAKNIEYNYVEYSYSELLILHQLISRAAKDINGIHGLAINEKENKVFIYTSDVNDSIKKFQSYIDENILYVVESEQPIER